MKDISALQRYRQRSTPEQRVRWVRRYEKSGLSQREFARRHHLVLFTLRNWIARNGAGAGGRGDGQPVWRELKLDGLPGTTRWAAEVVRPDGFVVRVAQDTPSAMLAELLRARPC